MAIDWVATLQVQTDLVLEVSTEVSKAVDEPDLTVEQASRFYRLVEQGARDFDAIVEIMDEHDVEDAFIAAAETIEDTWTNLSVATANRLRTMRGLEPIASGSSFPSGPFLWPLGSSLNSKDSADGPEAFLTPHRPLCRPTQSWLLRGGICSCRSHWVGIAFCRQCGFS